MDDRNKLQEIGESMKMTGDAMQGAGESMQKTGCAMTLGCTVPLLIVLVLLVVFLF